MSEELKSKSDISIVLFFFTALAVFGIAGGGFVVHDYARARASISWPAVEGVVLSQLEPQQSGLRYVYSIDGRSHESTRERVLLARFFHMSTPDYRPGESVTVYVNPANHSYAVLQPGGAGAAFVFFSVLSGVAVFFGLGGVVWTLSRGGDGNFIIARDTA
ncbi:DUF3592 domain-containing protein [Hyphococcus sp.]|uniref:DUF3592 domain-containing protein n=1 Tax=Hyphococcus sp. TaxID=2038636 RepID=UPI003CCC26E6